MTGENSVYRGQEGTGEAQIFGTAGDPFKAMMNVQANNQRQEAINYERSRQAKQERDKKTFDLLNYNPEETFQPFNKQVLKAAQDHQDWIVKQINQNKIDPNNPAFQASVAKGWRNVDNIARRGNYIKDVISTTRQQIKDNPYLDAKYYNDKINDLYMDDHGNGKPIDQVDVERIGNVHVDDPMGFNPNKYGQDFTKNLKKNVFNYVEQQAAANGRDQIQDIQVKIMADLMHPDPHDPQGIKRNPDGTPLVNITPDFVSSFLGNSDTAKRYYMQRAQMEGKPIEELIKQTVSPMASAEKDVKTSFSPGSPAWETQAYMKMANGGVLPWEKQGYTDRHNRISEIINAFPVDDSGGLSKEPTEAAKASLGTLTGAKFGDDYVMGADFLPGTNVPGTSQVLGKQVPNNASPQLVLRVKRNDKLPDKMVTVNLNDPGAYDKVNSMIETSKSEGGKKFATDDLLRINDVKREQVYKGRDKLAQAAEAGKRNENDQVAQWQGFNELEKMVGKTYKGQKIKDVKKQVSDPGVLGFGKKYGLQITTINSKGEEEYHDVDPENYNDLAAIHKSDEMVRVKSPDGKTGSVPKAKLKDALAKGYTLVQ